MNESKKEKAKKPWYKRLLKAVLIGLGIYFGIGFIFLIIGLIFMPDDYETPEKPEKEVVEEVEKEAEKEVPDIPVEDTKFPEPEPKTDFVKEEPEEVEVDKWAGYNKVGKTYSYTMDTDSGKTTDVEFTLTNWGTSVALNDAPQVYIEFHLKNVGNYATRVGNNLFNLYADNIAAEMEYGDDCFTISTVNPGREVVGKVYFGVNLKSTSVIELEVGASNTPFIIYDASAVVATNSSNASDTVEDESYIPEFGGHYEGKNTLIDFIDISIYSSPEEFYVGNAYIIYNGVEYSIPVGTNGYNYYTNSENGEYELFYLWR